MTNMNYFPTKGPVSLWPYPGISKQTKTLLLNMHSIPPSFSFFWIDLKWKAGNASRQPRHYYLRSFPTNNGEFHRGTHSHSRRISTTFCSPLSQSSAYLKHMLCTNLRYFCQKSGGNSTEKHAYATTDRYDV